DVREALTINGTGIGNTGALRSVSGINTWTTGGVALGTLAGSAAIGVDPDPNPSSTNDYFTNDYSLTIPTNISGGSSTVVGTTLAKVGTGQLILPNANTYTGQTQIQQGWITIQDNQSLGAPITGADSTQPVTTVSAGAALHLKPLLAGNNFTLVENLVLAG